MARQVGIHQIKGRYGTTSYYFRKRSKSGFLRSINQELSERVKTAENYAGTRIQNADFKFAMACSWCITSGWDTLKKFYLYSDMGARLAAFFRQYYVPYIGSESTDAQKALYLPRLENWFNVNQKNNNYVLDYFESSLSVSYVPNPQGQTFSFAVSMSPLLLNYAPGDISKRYASDSRVVLRVMSLDYNGKVLPQYVSEVVGTYGDLCDGNLSLLLSTGGSLLSPHLAWDSPLTSIVGVIELYPAEKGVEYISRAICKVFTVYVE